MIIVRGCCALAAVGLFLVSCSPRESVPEPSSVTFTVDPAMIGDTYEDTEIGFRFSPPADWEPLQDPQREAVLDALASETAAEADTYRMDVRDLFFNTDTLSFASVSVIGDPSGGHLDPSTYATAFGETIGIGQSISAEDEIVARMDFVVNDVSVIQFRHLQNDRVTFTLVFAGGNGRVVQADYSIPTDAYQRESVKLESSIGTIETYQTE